MKWFGKFKKYELKILLVSSMLLLIFSSYYFLEVTKLKIQDLKAQKQDVKDLEKTYAGILQYLSDLNYSSSSALLTQLNKDIDKKYSALAAAQKATAPSQTVTARNIPPGSGYSFQAVKTANGTFNVAIIAADLNSTRVIIDTASD